MFDEVAEFEGVPSFFIKDCKGKVSGREVSLHSSCKLIDLEGMIGSCEPTRVFVLSCAIDAGNDR